MNADERVFVNKLKKIDRVGNIFSAILSINEGNSKRPEQHFEFQKTVKNEADIIEIFFKNATTDSSILRDLFYGTNFVKNINETNTKLYLDMIVFCYEKIKDGVENTKKKHVYKEIIEKSEDLGISNGHPVVIFCIAALYENIDAKKILKIRQNQQSWYENSYNAYNDIMVISRYLMILHLQKELPISLRNNNFRFLTMDTHLKKSLKMISVEAIGSAQRTSSLFYQYEGKLHIKESFFGKMPQEIRDHLLHINQIAATWKVV